MFLYHYYDAKIGPFKNISDLSVDDAKQLLDEIKKKDRIVNVQKGKKVM